MGERRGTKALELWCRRMTEGYPGVRIDNMTTSWRNGMAFCALVHRFRPDLIDFDKLNAADVYDNNELAFRVAEAQLGIPALLDAADMASYEVPDRLSILTYLSQYYQTFHATAAAHQDSGARLSKRPSTATDMSAAKGNSTGPPAKMSQPSHPVVGVPKREPCVRCQLPVFLAERLLHAGRLYHRTCMRCARCRSQLTPGSFYETEADGQFCCETCPDEEKTDGGDQKQTAASEAEDREREAARRSFSHKLSLFQERSSAESTATTTPTTATDVSRGLLAKSLSDEEKSKSLKRLTALFSMPDGAAASAESSVRASFVWKQLGETSAATEQAKPAEESSSEEDDDDEDDGEDDEDDDDDDDDGDEPPALPTVEPPTMTEALSSDLIPSESIAGGGKPPVLPKPETIRTVSVDVAQVTELPAESQSIEEDKRPQFVAEITDVPSETTETEPIMPGIDVQTTEATTEAQRDEITEISTNLELHTTTKEPIDVVVAVPADVSDVPAIEEHSINVVPTPRTRTSKTAVTLEDSPAQVEAVLPIVKPVARERSSVVPLPVVVAEPEPSPPSSNLPLSAKPSYPVDFNPFGEDDDNDEDDSDALFPGQPEAPGPSKGNDQRRNSCNPFDSSDDEVELDKPATVGQSLNPFGDDDEDEDEDAARAADVKRTPVPTPRKVLPSSATHSTASSRQGTPEPLRRLHHNADSGASTPLHRNPQLYGSVSSMASTASALNAYTRRYKSRAPLPPSAGGTPSTPATPGLARYLSTLEEPSPRVSPSASGRSTPTSSVSSMPSSRKKRPAPKPPVGAAKEVVAVVPTVSVALFPAEEVQSCEVNAPDEPEEAVLKVDGVKLDVDDEDDDDDVVVVTIPTTRKLIPLDASLLNYADTPTIDRTLNTTDVNASTASATADTEVVYRRTLVPCPEDFQTTPPVTDDAGESHDRQWQKVKENKESLNKNRQSQGSAASSPESAADAATITANGSGSPNNGHTAFGGNKSTFGKWKRRKASAPPPPSSSASLMAASSSIIVQEGKRGDGVQMLPLTDIRYELEVIEVQQQGLEKQGIQLEKMIRERCESGVQSSSVLTIEEMANVPNTKEVEDLIMQLFEIVNEKNELFRRQAELMYLRRLHRLEQEQAQIEYDIRMLMEQPESNKTDSDKAREDGLIARKIEIVLQRNEVIDCLECDRLREAKEDESIKTRLDEHNARWDEELVAQQLAPVKLSKKEKKKLRETKKLAKLKKMDADKDADESEIKPGAADATAKKKKRKFLF